MGQCFRPNWSYVGYRVRVIFGFSAIGHVLVIFFSNFFVKRGKSYVWSYERCHIIWPRIWVQWHQHARTNLIITFIAPLVILDKRQNFVNDANIM